MKWISLHAPRDAVVSSRLEGIGKPVCTRTFLAVREKISSMRRKRLRDIHVIEVSRRNTGDARADKQSQLVIDGPAHIGIVIHITHDCENRGKYRVPGKLRERPACFCCERKPAGRRYGEIGIPNDYGSRAFLCDKCPASPFILSHWTATSHRHSYTNPSHSLATVNGRLQMPEKFIQERYSVLVVKITEREERIGLDSCGEGPRYGKFSKQLSGRSKGSVFPGLKKSLRNSI